MARISTYDRDLVISRDDMIIGTDADNSNITKNFSVGSLIDFIDSGNAGSANYYLSGITANSSSGVITFTVNGTTNQELTLGTAAFQNTSDFLADDATFNLSQVAGENDVTAYYLNVSGNGTSGQLLASDGDGSFSWVDSSAVTDTNYYLSDVTRTGNVVKFTVNGTNNHQITFGSAAFESVSTIVSQVSDDLSIDDLNTDSLGDLAYLDTVTGNEIATNAVTTLKIKDSTITEEKLKVSNSPTSGYVLTSDGDSGFTWAANSASNYYLDGISRSNETLTFAIDNGTSPRDNANDVTFTFGNAAFKDVEAQTTGRSSDKIPRADHTHSMSHVTDAGDLAILDSVDTGQITNGAITPAKLDATVGTDGQVLKLNSSLELEWAAAGSGSTNFIALSDTPSSFRNAGDILKINSAGDAVEFVDFEVSNVNHFSTVNTGTAGKVLAVDVNNDGSTGYKGLKWVDTSQVGATTFTALTDTPASIGTAHQLLTVNAAGTDLEYRALDANHIANDLITNAMIADETITGGDGGNIGEDAIVNFNIADDAVQTAQIQNSAVTENKLGTSAVTNTKIGTNAVTTAKINDGNVTLAKLNSDVTLSALPNAANTRTDWDTAGNTKIDWYVNSNNEMRLLADGTLHVDGDVIAYSTTIASDKNLKNNIQNFTSPIEKVKQLNGVTFNWARNGKQSGGVIAQDVKEVLPSLVSEIKSLDDTSGHLAVDYNGIIGLLIETVKEQQTQIDELKKQLS